jgi:DNA sulfur modification protein DndD
MKISKITLYNFRIFKGLNDITFSPSSEGNISIIAGKNGFGKTTLLTSLLWAFYGRLMGQVENKYRLDIKYSGGYQPFLKSLLNREIENQTDDSGKNFYVDIKLEELSIPALPCNSISIRRSYDLENDEEKLSILIDGIENELTKEVGYDLFINDFILPREIAKFFFFDAEKIVSLAEAKSKEELRSLNRAYSEVLGIKKYEELKKNLESLSSKLLRKGISEKEKVQLDNLLERESESLKLLEYNLEQQQINKEELVGLNWIGRAK